MSATWRGREESTFGKQARLAGRSGRRQAGASLGGRIDASPAADLQRQGPAPVKRRWQGGRVRSPAGRHRLAGRCSALPQCPRCRGCERRRRAALCAHSARAKQASRLQGRAGRQGGQCEQQLGYIQSAAVPQGQWQKHTRRMQQAAVYTSRLAGARRARTQVREGLLEACGHVGAAVEHQGHNHLASHAVQRRPGAACAGAGAARAGMQ
jgi:hypothetical protein